MNFLKITILILILLIITSCAAKREQTYLKNDENSCNVVCIGDVKFHHQSKNFRHFDYNKNKWVNFDYDDESKRTSLFSYNHCLLKQYDWNAIDQKEIDRGLQICSAQIAPYNAYSGFHSTYHCGPYDTNADERKNIILSLGACTNAVIKANKQMLRNRTTYLTNKEKEKEKEKVNEQQQKVNNAKKTCRSLGFTEAQHIAECGLKILTAEKDLQESGTTNNSGDALARQMQLNNSIRLMQQGLKLMNPPPRPQINCRTTLLGWTCN